MFSFIKGKIAAIEENLVVIENNGIGFELFVSSNTIAILSGKTDAMLYTYLQVKEDGLTLYGFNSMQEKKMFLNLITVSGVGCKVGLAVLSGISLRELALTIVNEDTAMLTRIKGIGKKTAERIILELKEKVSAFENDKSVKDDEAVLISGNAEEAYSALMALGLKRGECLAAVKRAIESGAKSTEDVINFALKNMGR